MVKLYCTRPPAPSIIQDVSGGMAAAARLPLRLFWKSGHLADPGCTLVGTKAKNRPLSVLREGYWTAYGDREAFRVGILKN